jgi:hypothetical protein
LPVDGSPPRTRTWNDWTKTSCVADYTNGECFEGIG